MSKVKFQQHSISLSGVFPIAGMQAPDFTLCDNHLFDIKLSDFKGKKLILNIFPSIDTAVCALSVKRFNQEAAAYPDVHILCVSADLPFAMGRFCGAEGIDKVKTASFFRSPHFTQDYGVGLTEGPLRGLAARSVVVIDAHGKVVYSELVFDIANEPNYAKALAALA